MKKLIAIRLRESDLAVLKELALVRDETLSEMVRDAVEDYVQQRIKDDNMGEGRSAYGLAKIWKKAARKDGKK